MDARFYCFADFELDARRRLLSHRTRGELAVTSRAFDTLLYLVTNAGRLATKRELTDAVWPDTAVEENNLAQAISTLRQLLGERPNEHRFIVTVPGQGYRFIAPVTAAQDSRELVAAAQPAPAVAEVPPPARKSQLAAIEPRALHTRPLVRAAAVLLVVATVALVALALRREDASIPANRVQAIAVLPFQPLVAGAADSALEFGMADALIQRLSVSPSLVVRPLSSVRKFAALDQDPLAAGQALGVDAVLVGSIHRDGAALRVTARLLRVGDGVSLWAGEFDHTFTSVLTLQAAIADEAVRALAVRLSEDQRRELARRYPQNEEAYRLYALGRYHLYKLTPPEIDRGIAHFLQAIEIDPDYALAYLGLAEAHRALAIVSDRRATDVLPKAKAAAQRAIELDRGLAEAHASLCFIQIWSDWDWPAAEASCQRAIALDANCADAHRAYAILLSDLGQHERAIAEARRAAELDPLALITRAIEGHVLLYAGRNAEALARLRASVELEPSFWVAHVLTGKAQLAEGRLGEALASFVRARELSRGSSEAISLTGYTLARMQDRAGATRALDELRTLAGPDGVPAFNVAMVYAGLGERDAALDWLERAYLDRDVRLTFLRVERKWDWLRADARFAALARRMRLE